MKIFNKNLKKNIRTVGLQPKLTIVNKMKYLPAFSKEWKNIVYSFNKNNLKNIPMNTVNINKIIQNYFNLFFNNHRFIKRTKFVHLRKRRRFLKRIFVSNADIKYTNNNAKITLYTINKEKKALRRRYYKLTKRLTHKLFRNYAYLQKKLVHMMNSFIHEKFETYYDFIFVSKFLKKSTHLKTKMKYLRVLTKLSQTARRKMWNKLIEKQSYKYYVFLRKYTLLYSLNQWKFNKQKLLSKLTYLLEKILGRKINYNIINLKSITYHPDILTDILALKIRKDRGSPRRRMNNILHKARIAKENIIKERSTVQNWDKIDTYRDKNRDLKVVSLIETNSFPKMLTNIKTKRISASYKNKKKNIYNSIFNSIGYKNLSGIKLKVSGRLTKRYRADRSIQALKWKGVLKNIDSSFKKLSAVSFRGNTNSNVSYSWTKSKRRIGSFAVKGWIGAK